ncbi:hypothetical protein Lnau_0699 [Legionella nautarum]|uniref:Uncharacterized protein n=1 Tax=Legionella nautarum TaxID=45070 RepID=A0A0W0WTQ7_9GAMM|nr:hypothetical protein [Legionella nautarum]KTD35715.1 hypothetical protein Lnau_0699 [Legionella nautarum]
MKRLFLLPLALLQPLSSWAITNHSYPREQVIIKSSPSVRQHDHGKENSRAANNHHHERQAVMVPGAPRHHGHNYAAPQGPRLPAFVKKILPGKHHRAEVHTHSHD